MKTYSLLSTLTCFDRTLHAFTLIKHGQALVFLINAAVTPGCRLFIVGSSLSGFGTRLSDMDLCLLVSQMQVTSVTWSHFLSHGTVQLNLK